MPNNTLFSNVQPDAEIRIEAIGGDLVIEGSAGNEFPAGGDHPQINIKGGCWRLSVACNGDCRLRVPTSVQLTIDSVSGDAKISGVGGLIRIETVGADLTLRDAGEIRVRNVGADLKIKRASGSVEVDVVGADAEFRGITGSVNVKSVGADALVNEVTGSCTIETIGADLVLDTDFAPETRYNFLVGSDVTGRVSPDANVRFEVPEGNGISVQVPGAQFSNEGDKHVIVFGNGSSVVKFESIGGELRLVSQGESIRGPRFHGIPSIPSIPSIPPIPPIPPIPGLPEDLEDVIEARISEQLNAINDRLNRQQERLHREAERLRRDAQRKAE